jgi:hypothetical protein
MPPGDKPSGTDFAKFILPLLASILLVGLLTGCPASKTEATSANRAAPSTLNNCYSLLHQLLDEEKDVGLLRFIKREHADVSNLVKKIAATAGTDCTLLEKLAHDDPTINLKDIGLPPGEVATRDSIASTKKKALLGEKGDELELTLLLTQTEALSYAWHLAKVASENESQPDRVRELAGVSEEMKNLYQEVFAMLLSKGK